MNLETPRPPAAATFARLAVAAALAGFGATSQAGVATLSIDAFIVGSTSGFVTVTDSWQNFRSEALNDGGLSGAATDSRTQSNWNLGPNVTAQTSMASATGVMSQFVDAFGLTTPGFSLNATTEAWPFPYPLIAPPNQATAIANLAGSFGLVDGNGDPVEGDITFQVYYTMNVLDAISRPATDYAQAQLDVSAFDDDESFAEGVGALSTNFAGGASGDISGLFTWTFNLARGEVVSFNLDGTTVALSSVPEPGGLALAALALGGLGFARRSRS